MSYILKNATVITMDDYKILYNTDVFVANGKIRRIAHRIRREVEYGTK